MNLRRWAFVLVAAALVLYVGILEYRVRAADARVAAVEKRIEEAKLEAIEISRTAAAEQLARDKAGRAPLEAALVQERKKAAQLQRQLDAHNADIAKGREAAALLVTSGTLDQVLELGARLGYHPIPMARPR